MTLNLPDPPEFHVRAQWTPRLKREVVVLSLIAVAFTALTVVVYTMSTAWNAIVPAPAALILTVAVLIKIKDPIRNKTKILATPAGIRMTFMGFKPWSEVESISMGLVANVQKREDGRELSRRYTREIYVKSKNNPHPSHDAYRDTYDRPWTDLFDYIDSVAPHVELLDRQEYDHTRYERERNQP
ncbi:hypothetical protein [Nocardia aurea]|uniref:PH domain-containing protein n=1 Tax=Nocardia aurea TaxID=2144174 RepID=A0ABV3FL46_9NOCA